MIWFPVKSTLNPSHTYPIISIPHFRSVVHIWIKVVQDSQKGSLSKISKNKESSLSEADKTAHYVLSCHF